MIRGNVQIMPGTIDDARIDPDSRLKSSSSLASSGSSDEFTYDSAGNIVSVLTTFSSGVSRTVSYTRNAQGDIVSYSVSFSDNSYSATYNISRDVNGRITAIVKV